eukprot:9502005-Pyramimonas_sp.AAC.1
MAGSVRRRTVANATRQRVTFAPRAPQGSNGRQAHPPWGASFGAPKKAQSAATAQASQHGKQC